MNEDSLDKVAEVYKKFTTALYRYLEPLGVKYAEVYKGGNLIIQHVNTNLQLGYYNPSDPFTEEILKELKTRSTKVYDDVFKDLDIDPAIILVVMQFDWETRQLKVYYDFKSNWINEKGECYHYESK